MNDEVIEARCAHLSPVERRYAKYQLGVELADVDGPPIALLVGEAPAPNGHGRADFAMFPWPATSAAGRLLKFSGLPPALYLGRFFRRNLMTEYQERWSAPRARDRAADVRVWMRSIGQLRVVLMGQKVGAAFGLNGFFERHSEITNVDGVDQLQEIVAIPHPSGLNRMYADPQVRRGTELAMRWAAGCV